MSRLCVYASKEVFIWFLYIFRLYWCGLYNNCGKSQAMNKQGLPHSHSPKSINKTNLSAKHLAFGSIGFLPLHLVCNLHNKLCQFSNLSTFLFYLLLQLTLLGNLYGKNRENKWNLYRASQEVKYHENWNLCIWMGTESSRLKHHWEAVKKGTRFKPPSTK